MNCPSNFNTNEDSSELYRFLVDQIQDYAIYMLDVNGCIASWNEGARRLKGYEAHEIIGKHFSQFYPKQDIESGKPAFELKMTEQLGRYEDEGWRIRKDGSRFWANVIVTALRDNEGRLLGFAKVTRDLTQRKLQEEHFQKVLENEERFRLLVDQVKDYAIFILDARGNIISWNQGAKRLKGYSSDEIIGKHFSIFYTEPDLKIDKPAHELSVAIRDGRYEEEGWRLRKDGSRFWANVVITSIWDKRGHLTGFAKVTRDLTQRRAAEESLRQKTETLEAFAHTISHDLGAPLRSIGSFTDILNEEYGNVLDETAKGYLGRVTNSVKFMERLIKDILHYSHINTATITMEPVPLTSVIQNVIRILEQDINAANAKVVIRGELPVVQGNATLLSQIFLNLIGNSLKFVPEERTPLVDIFAEDDQFFTRVYVKDNGIGVNEEYWQKIFEVFERLSKDERYPGTGIGLAIVRRAVERLGGRIELKSVIDQGSTFIIHLPRSENGETR